ncbi:apoptosis inhibitor 5-like protein API5 [Spinacia oleracea]|uniref:Apoptosis inhibitor 5-like protein API5 n=1 Tax=Spinacia oleracea TaxID=3562 RepID=A0A9R0IAY1_SPIOL|nr:apoptosis inhibitor 5-like protein API5 [Spinacia oleracea]XP_056687142.1 apoptosis inhibitor 5-like protein API5 [Spinacia oleracea]
MADAATTSTTATTNASSAAVAVEDANKDIEKLYEFGERLSEAKDKSENVKDYEGIIKAAKGSSKAKQLAAQLIPRFFKYFPNLSSSAVDAHLDLCEEEDLGVRVQAIRGLPLFCKDTPEYVSKIVDILAQLLMAEENVERDAVQKALMSLLRQDVKASLSALFKHIESIEESTDENIREKVLAFIRDKVFPLKAELLKPQEQMERHITDLVKKSLRDVTGAEFKMFIDFLKSLNLFGDKAPTERVQELIEIIESQADLDAQFDVLDVDHINRLISCQYIAIPFFMRGASNSNFLNYVNKHIIPVFDKIPEERKLDLLKNLAESSPYTAPQDARQILPYIVQLLKKYMPRKRTGEEMNFTYVECLLYTFHHLASKAPNASNSLCGYKIVTGQPSDRIGEDFSENYKDFTERLNCVEELSRATMKKLTQGMDEQNKRMASASNEVKDKIKTEKQNATTGLKTCNNILAMTQPLHKNSPSFIGDKRINLSWKEPVKSAVPSATVGGKRPASAALNGSNSNAAKKGRGGGQFQNQLVNRAFDGISYGGRGGGRGGRGRGWGGGRPGRGRGRGYR